MANNTVIFGDSYSTFEGFIPAGYAPYYHKSCGETDVRNVGETWWRLVAEDAGLNIVLNDSWSGSTIGYTGYNNTDCSLSSSFIYRFQKLTDSGFFKENDINTVFIFGGTNDNWSNAPLGNTKFDDFKNDDFYSVLPAICYFLKTVKETLPSAEVYCLVNTDLKPEITDAFKKACEKYGVTEIAFKHIDKQCGHPTVKGMQDIKNEIIKVLNK